MRIARRTREAGRAVAARAALLAEDAPRANAGAAAVDVALDAVDAVIGACVGNAHRRDSVARLRRAIEVEPARLAERAGRALTATAVDVGLGAVAHTVGARIDVRDAEVRRLVADVRHAVEEVSAREAVRALPADGSAAIDVALRSRLAMVGALIDGARERDRVARAGRAVLIHRAPSADRARGARAAAVDVSLVVVLRAVAAGGRVARVHDRVAGVRRAVGVDLARASGTARRALVAAAVDVRLVPIPHVIVARGRFAVTVQTSGAIESVRALLSDAAAAALQPRQ